MQLGMVGLGRMGANIVRRLMRAGHECVVFDVNPESVLVIQGDTLVTRDARLSDTDIVEIRPVTSGGAA